VGIENVHDLLADLHQAFDLATHPLVVNVRSVRRRDTGDEESLSKIPGANKGMVEEGGVHREDVASVAQAECARLQSVNAVLRERLMALETTNIQLEAARRSSAGGIEVVSGPGGRKKENLVVSPSDAASTATALSLAALAAAVIFAAIFIGRNPKMN